MNKIRRLLVVALAVLAVSLIPRVGRAQSLGADSGQVSITLRPSDAQSNPVTGPGYFDLSMAPGATTTLDALVGNDGTRTATARMVAVDATSGVFGGVSYNLPEQPRKAVASWVTLPTLNVSLEPGTARVVPLTITIPAGTQPGQYVGGLTAYVPVARPKKGGFGGVQLQTRLVTAIEVNVAGALQAHLIVKGVSPQRRPDGVYLLIHIWNTGKVLLKGQGTLTVYSPRSPKPVLTTTVALDTTVPHTQLHYPLYLGRTPLLGMYHYTMTLAWTGGSLTSTHRSWQGGKVTRRGHFQIKQA